MHKILQLVCCLLIFQSCTSQNFKNEAELVEVLDSLVSNKSFFQTKEIFKTNKEQLSDFQKLRFSAITNNLFNKPNASNNAIDSLFNLHESKIDAEEAKDLLETKLSNCVKLFEYKTVDSVTEVLINNYESVYEKDELWSVKNNGIIWKALKDYPKQKTVIKDSSRIKLFRDKAGLKNLSVKVNQELYPFIFDTGANLSVVIESQAEKMNVDIINKEVSVNTITGQRVNAKIGVAKTFSINNIDFENVVFLVFPDKAFYIPQIDYQIKGILGFPVISAMNEVHFTKNNEIHIPKISTFNKPQNLAIQYLTPYINIKTKDGKTYSFSFDTGASSTFLYKPYFLQYKKHIENKYKLDKINFAGGGGNITVNGYKIPLEIDYNNTIIKLNRVSVLPEVIDGMEELEYGNLGQDFISQFETMIINFEKMFVHFE